MIQLAFVMRVLAWHSYRPQMKIIPAYDAVKRSNAYTLFQQTRSSY